MKIFRQAVAFAVIASASAVALAQDKVAYHINDAAESALGTLRNMKNHLDTDPTAQLTLVAHAQGVDFLMNGAKDKNGAAYAGAVAALKARGVNFEVCEITLKNRKLSKDQFILEADYTPSGVVRLTKLQTQGYAYIKP